MGISVNVRRLDLKLFKKEREKKSTKREYLIDKDNKAILDSKGLIPCIIQEDGTREVLHIGYMDKWALDSTLSDLKIFLFKRSKNRIEIFVDRHSVEYQVAGLVLHSSRRAILITARLPNDNSSETEFTNRILPKQETTDTDDAFLSAVEQADPDTLLGSPSDSNADAFSDIKKTVPKDPFVDDDEQE